MEFNFFAYRSEEPVNWKLSNQENFSRMRPKLTQNYNHDQHLEASRQRDNVGESRTSPSFDI